MQLIFLSHMFSTLEEFKAEIDENIDENGDSFARDVTRDELRTVCCHRKYGSILLNLADT